MKGVIYMVQATINFRMDENVKKSMEDACKELGLSMTAAFTVFATKMGREKRIPFDVAVDPFYSDVNMNRLRKAIEDVRSGKSKLTEHELIKVEDD
jgi:DNA-damage-inducible protein J